MKCAPFCRKVIQIFSFLEEYDVHGKSTCLTLLQHPPRRRACISPGNHDPPAVVGRVHVPP